MHRLRDYHSAGLIVATPDASLSFAQTLRSPLAALAIIVTGLAGRAALDKVLALRGGPHLVAFWAQLASVIELVWGPALAGVGTGIAVLAAQYREPATRRALLADGLRSGILLAAAMVALALAAGAFFPGALIGAQAPWLVALAAGAGWIATAGGVANGYWMGTRETGKMLALAAALALVPLGAALAAPGAPAMLLALVTLAHAVPAAALAAFLPWRSAPGAASHERLALRRYLLPGISIGILSPASLIAARAILSAHISWDGAGLVQALWRASDWVGTIAAGVLSIHFLPRLSAAAGTPAFRAELRRAAFATALPAAAAFSALYACQREALALLYAPEFRMPDAAAAMFLAGSALRVAAWVALFGLYAERRTVAIAAGEVFSLPLFALLLAAWPALLTLEAAGRAWLIAYGAYAAFNAGALARARRHRIRQP
jgi:hypothetical protein